MNQQLQSTKEVNEKQLQVANTQVDELRSQLAKKSALSPVVWVLIVLLACAVGVLVGRAFN